jgi:hypothetical protein
MISTCLALQLIYHNMYLLSNYWIDCINNGGKKKRTRPMRATNYGLPTPIMFFFRVYKDRSKPVQRLALNKEAASAETRAELRIARQRFQDRNCELSKQTNKQTTTRNPLQHFRFLQCNKLHPRGHTTSDSVEGHWGFPMSAT